MVCTVRAKRSGSEEVVRCRPRGCPKEDQYTLTWDDINFEINEIHISNPKNGEPRNVHMIKSVVKAMKVLQQTPLERKRRSVDRPNTAPANSVFSIGDNKKWFNSVMKRAEVAESSPAAAPATPAAEPVAYPATRLLADCVVEYIAETKEHKSAKTLAPYRLTTIAFCASVSGVSPKDIDDGKFLAQVASKGIRVIDVTRDHLLAYSAALRKGGSSPRTIRNRIDHLQIFLHHFGCKSLLKGSDLPNSRTRRSGRITRQTSARCSSTRDRTRQTAPLPPLHRC